MDNIIFRAKSPLRIGLAGGGTDIPSYSEKYGGAILNATISMYAYASLEPLDNGRIIFHSIDRDTALEYPAVERIEPDGSLDLFKGVYNSIIKNFVKKPLSFKLTTFVDAPPGSGLGSSSTLVVSTIGAFAEWLKLPLGEYDIAYLAYVIERKDLGFAGGMQDQYAATFGGFNFMEFHNESKVIVNPLRIKPDHQSELEFNLILFYTSISRLSSEIIEAQEKNIRAEKQDKIEAMHNLKKQATYLKEALLTGNFESIGKILHFGWMNKRKTADEVSNPLIDEFYETALSAGSTGGKISGAGGGGFAVFYCPGNTRYKVVEALKRFNGEFRRYNFTNNGLATWTTDGKFCR